jgi:hypothetical protein
MKKVLFIAVMFSLLFLNSQVEWQQDGIPIRQGVNIEWFRSAIELPGGGCVYTWSDTRFGDRDAFAQRVDPDGNMLWGEAAVMVNGEIDRQEDIVVINGAGDETIYAWVDFRHEIDGDIYAQKLDGDGNIMWAPEGVPLCLVEDVQISLNIVSDDNGGAYIIWLDSRNQGGTDIYGTHILSDGSIADGWDEGGSPIVSAIGSQSQHTFWADGEGGAVCVWLDERDNSNKNLYMQRIAPDGTHLWEEQGSILCGAPGIQESGKMSPDGAGGFIISWRDRREDFSGDIYANRIDLDGNVLWENDLVVYAGPAEQLNPRITEADDGGALVAWEDYRGDFTYSDIYVQKINLDGTLAWSPDGVIVSDAELHQLNPRIVGDDDGGAWIIWDDGRNGDHPNEDIYYQHINYQGIAMLEPNGRIACDAFGLQEAPLIKKDDTGQIYLTWGDNRTGSTGIYHQLIDDSGNLLLEDNGEMIYYGLSGDATQYNLLNTSDNRFLFWKDSRLAVIASQIYMQVLNDDGSFGLIEDGVPITEMTGANQENLVCEIIGDDAVIVWEELRGDKMKTYIQKVDSDSNRYWGEQGLQLSTRDTAHEDAQLSIYNGACYIGWSDLNNDDFMNPIFLISAQKVIDGVIQWDEEGIIVADNPGDDVLVAIVDNYFIWELQVQANYDIYASLVTEDGEVAENWPENGLLVCGAQYNQLNAQAVMTPAGLLIVWEDLRNGEDSDIYGQLIASDGTTAWQDDGLPLVVQPQDQSGFKLEYYENYFYLIWEDMRNETDYDIYMQKYDLDGNQIWQDGGIAAVVKPNQQANPAWTFGNDTILIYWDDVDDEYDVNLFAKMFYFDGSVVAGWAQDGLMICGAIKGQQNPVAVYDELDYSYVIWSDFRSSGKTDIYNIYGQKLRHADTAIDEFEIDNAININLNNYPNPFRNGTMLTFDLGRNQLLDGSVEIYNVKGQKVRTLETDSNRVFWDGLDNNGKMTSTGVYMYQFKNKYFTSETSKMIRVK